MNDVSNDKPLLDPPASPRRRSLLQAIALGAGATAFYGPWKTNHVWAQAAGKKPLVIGLTMDTSGQYGASGSMERLGAMLAIREFNEKGGVLGRPIEALHMDTETTPATGSRVAERMITRNEAAFLIGGLHSGVANAPAESGRRRATICRSHARAVGPAPPGICRQPHGVEGAARTARGRRRSSPRPRVPDDRRRPGALPRQR